MTRELTYGEKAVGINFNPSKDDAVHQMKTAYALIIDDIQRKREAFLNENNFEGVRLCAIAITEAQTAQMWAVKALTWSHS